MSAYLEFLEDLINGKVHPPSGLAMWLSELQANWRTHFGEPEWYTPLMTDLLDQAGHEETEQSESARSMIEIATNRKGQGEKTLGGITVG